MCSQDVMQPAKLGQKHLLKKLTTIYETVKDKIEGQIFYHWNMKNSFVLFFSRAPTKLQNIWWVKVYYLYKEEQTGMIFATYF